MHILLLFPGYSSFRDPTMGSFFMRDLVNVFTEKSHTDHVEDMITEVSTLHMSIESVPACPFYGNTQTNKPVRRKSKGCALSFHYIILIRPQVAHQLATTYRQLFTFNKNRIFLISFFIFTFCRKYYRSQWWAAGFLTLTVTPIPDGRHLHSNKKGVYFGCNTLHVVKFGLITKEYMVRKCPI